MNTATEPTTIHPDSAAVFAGALSLWEACQKQAASDPKLNFSESYNGMDQFMRELMRVANQFEEWACQCIDFTRLNEPWSYLLQDDFGETCLQVISPAGLTQFNAADCLRVSLRMGLPVKLDIGLPVPVDVSAANPLYAANSTFQSFRIQTIRDSIEDTDCVPFYALDDPFDPEFSAPYFGLYGVEEDGLLEHIADRRTYAEALNLAKKLVPGVTF